MLKTIRGRGRCVRYGLIIICSSLALGCSDAGPKPPGPPATLAVVSGDAQQATVTHALPDPIEVRVLDANGRGVPGVTVAFEVTSDNGAVSPAQATTDANGDAQTQWTMGTLAATDRALTARVDNVPLGSAPLVATIHAAALAGPAAALAIVTEPAAAARSGAPLFRQPSLLLVDLRQSGTTSWRDRLGADRQLQCRPIDRNHQRAHGFAWGRGFHRPHDHRTRRPGAARLQCPVTLPDDIVLDRCPSRLTAAESDMLADVRCGRRR